MVVLMHRTYLTIYDLNLMLSISIECKVFSVITTYTCLCVLLFGIIIFVSHWYQYFSDINEMKTTVLQSKEQIDFIPLVVALHNTYHFKFFCCEEQVQFHLITIHTQYSTGATFHL